MLKLKIYCVFAEKSESTEKSQETDDVPESESGGTESHLAAPNSEETIPAELEPTVDPIQEEETGNTSEEVTPSVSPEPVVCEDKSTQNDPLFSAKVSSSWVSIEKSITIQHFCDLFSLHRLVTTAILLCSNAHFQSFLKKMTVPREEPAEVKWVLTAF